MTLSAIESIESTKPKSKRVKCGGDNPPPGFTCNVRFKKNRPHHIYHHRRCSKLAYQLRKEDALRKRIVEEMKAKRA